MEQAFRVDEVWGEAGDAEEVHLDGHAPPPLLPGASRDSPSPWARSQHPPVTRSCGRHHGSPVCP